MSSSHDCHLKLNVFFILKKNYSDCNMQVKNILIKEKDDNELFKKYILVKEKD
jgi:hypothetical protein